MSVDLFALIFLVISVFGLALVLVGRHDRLPALTTAGACVACLGAGGCLAIVLSQLVDLAPVL